MKDNDKIRNDDSLILWPEEDLILWCRILSKMDMLSWAQLDACGGWGATGLRMALADRTPSVQMYFDGVPRCASEPLSAKPDEPPNLRLALRRLLEHPMAYRWSGQARMKRLLSRKLAKKAGDDTWVDWLLDNGFTPVVRVGDDDYGHTAWLEWRHKSGLTLHQKGADEPAAGLWYVRGFAVELGYLTPEDAILDAAGGVEDAS